MICMYVRIYTTCKCRLCVIIIVQFLMVCCIIASILSITHLLFHIFILDGSEFQDVYQPDCAEAVCAHYSAARRASGNSVRRQAVRAGVLLWLQFDTTLFYGLKHAIVTTPDSLTHNTLYANTIFISILLCVWLPVCTSFMLVTLTLVNTLGSIHIERPYICICGIALHNATTPNGCV